MTSFSDSKEVHRQFDCGNLMLSEDMHKIVNCNCCKACHWTTVTSWYSWRTVNCSEVFHCHFELFDESWSSSYEFGSTTVSS